MKKIMHGIKLLLMCGVLLTPMYNITIADANTTGRLTYGDDFGARYVEAVALPVFEPGLVVVNSQAELARFQLPSDVIGVYTGAFFDTRYLVVVSRSESSISMRHRVHYINTDGTIIIDKLTGSDGFLPTPGQFHIIIDVCRRFQPEQFTTQITTIHESPLIISAFRPHTFSAAIVGYGEQVPHSVELWTLGEQPIGELTISLSGRNADSFVLDRTTIPSLDVNETAVFTIVPRTGLPVGPHMATVTIEGDDLEQPWTFLVRFVVESDIVEPDPTPTPIQTPTPQTTTPTVAPTTTPPGTGNPPTSDNSSGYMFFLLGGLALIALLFTTPKLIRKGNNSLR